MKVRSRQRRKRRGKEIKKTSYSYETRRGRKKSRLSIMERMRSMARPPGEENPLALYTVRVKVPLSPPRFPSILFSMGDI